MKAPLRDDGARWATLAISAAAIVAGGVLSWWALGAGAPGGGGAATPGDDAAEPETAPHVYADIPRIDVHVHVPPSRVDEALAIFREHGVYLALNASGGHPGGGGLETSREIAERTEGALRPYCNLDFRAVEGRAEPFDEYARRSLDACRAQGAVGLKIFKSLGLGITLADGSLLAIDDPRLDVVFEYAGELGLPVLIHSGDPQAFFEPDGPGNERHAELSAHPSWSFHGPRPDGQGDWPSWREVFDQFERRVARHPHTTFVGAHFGNAPEEPETVSRMLDAYPNLVVETGARIPEIGRHPAARMRELFIRHSDRILFGTDFQTGSEGTYVLGSAGARPDPASRIPFFYGAHWRYFETDDRGFEHPTPIQGDWRIDGISLPREVLEQLYWRNAARVFGLPAPE